MVMLVSAAWKAEETTKRQPKMSPRCQGDSGEAGADPVWLVVSRYGLWDGGVV